MATTHHHRLLIVVPTATVASVNSWLRTNIDPGGGDWLVAELNGTGGAAAATHRVCCAGLDNADFGRIVTRLCSLAGITRPANWNTMSRAAKRAWLHDQRPAIESATGILLLHSDNDGAWGDWRALLASKGLYRRHLASVVTP